ncbi:MAG: cytidylate kinase [Hyphomicrobiales bacterium]|nr:(d)CMP kinase [Hyphomicrobiales bacterium]PCH50762.1 MAG: cytidylate kinase [Hyphomicrobiales bacterium]
MKNPLIIAIDGPAASGKGTLSRKLATHFDLPHLDTGLIYRAVGQALLQVDLPLDNEELAAEVAQNIDFSKLDRKALSVHEIGEAASKVAIMPKVREILLQAQRDFAAKGAVLDGRDIGTVVCPNADIKLFVTASPQIRAKRRFDEMIERGRTQDDVTYEAVLADLKVRDDRDMNRKDAPLKPAQDAHLIDTSKMDIETAFQTVLDLVKHTGL